MIFSIIRISASENSIKDVQRLSYGLHILPSYALHRANMLPPKPMSICCPTFTEGKGLGYDFSIYTKYVLDYEHSISASFGYRDIGARLMTDTYGKVNAMNQEAMIRSTLETALSMINIQCMYQWSPFQRFDLISGFIMGINASKNYTYQENIISSDAVFDNGLQQRNTSIGALAGINPRYFGVILGASYRISISDNLFIKTVAQYTHALRPIQFGTNWYADALTIGLGFEYFPYGEIKRPIYQSIPPDNPIVENQVEPKSEITITNKKNGFIWIEPHINYLPMLDIVYADSFEKEMQFDNICSEDHGSCHYPWMMDTIRERMKKYPDENLQVQIARGNINLAQQFMELAKSREIDTSKLRIQFSDKLGSQVFATLKANQLLGPYITITHDTAFRHASVQFKVNSPDQLEFEWGLFDNGSETIIRKGRGITNQELNIDSIPLDFRNGILRCLIIEQGQKSLIQSNLNIDSPQIRIFDPRVYEIAALFDVNKDSLRQIDIESLIMYRNALSKQDTIIVEAFTDLSGDMTLNEDLSRRRASSVATYFPNQPIEIILSPLKARNSGKKEYQKAYNRIVTVKRKQP